MATTENSFRTKKTRYNRITSTTPSDPSVKGLRVQGPHHWIRHHWSSCWKWQALRFFASGVQGEVVKWSRNTRQFYCGKPMFDKKLAMCELLIDYIIIPMDINYMHNWVISGAVIG